MLAIGKSLTDFADRYQVFFRSKTRSSFGAASRYLNGLFLSEERTFEAMASTIAGANAQQFQHFIANSPWDHRPLLRQVAKDADRLLGGKADSCLIIDESTFPKKGEQTVGVARQWCGRLGKVDNCQVGVFCALSDGVRHTLIDEQLYLPKEWTSNSYRCDQAGIPRSFQEQKSKAEMALEMVREARRNGVRFSWIGFDAGYGKHPELLRSLESDGEIFVADVQSSQRVYLNDPCLHVPEARTHRGRPPRRRRAKLKPTTVQDVMQKSAPSDWRRIQLRDTTRGPLIVDVATRLVWLWDGQEETPRRWHLVVRREVMSPKTIKYSLSNAPVDTSLKRLAQMQGHRYWVERSFQDAKESCGLADHQGRSWTVWHHHVSMAMLALLFVLEQRIEKHSEVDMLSPGDIVLILKSLLPVTDDRTEATRKRINQRHEKRHSAIRSRYRPLEERFDPCI